MRNLFLLAVMLSFCIQCIFAQDQKIEIEKIREKCESIPREQRVRISVARFKVTSPKVPNREFGAELATMLTSALQQANCFRVLENLGVMEEDAMFKEALMANSTEGMLASQAILTGDITEFSESSNKTQVAGFRVGGAKARIGFIIKIVDPVSRDVLWTKSVEAESRKPGTFSGLDFGGWIKIAGSNKYNKAVADAVERGIIKAVYLLSEDREKIDFPEPDNSATTVLEVSGAGFMELKKLMDSLKEESQLKSVVRTSFKQDHGTLQIRHELTEDEILNIVAEKGAGLAEIVGFEGNVIQVQIVDK